MPKVKICLDAGHHGKSNQSPANPDYYESEAMWALKLYIKQALERYGIEVVTTRDALDTEMDLWERGQKGRGCTLFVSLHSNAVANGIDEEVDRPVVICYSEDDATAIDEVSRELGMKLAKCIEDTMETAQPAKVVLKKADWDRNKDGIFNDEWYGVLDSAKRAGTVGILLEHSFHTQTRATNWLLDDDNLRKMAAAEAAVIAEYYGLQMMTMQEAVEIIKAKTGLEQGTMEFLQCYKFAEPMLVALARAME